MKVKCPSCGAEFETESGIKIIKCPYCRSSIFITEETGTLEKIIPLISYDAAKERFSKENINEGFELIYIPFYKVLKDGIEHYLIGIKNAGYELKSFIPQGDRIPIDKKIVEPEIKIENPISLTFSPFYRTKKGDLLCAVTGDIIRSEYIEEREKRMNFLPLGIFFISGLLGIIIKPLILKIIIPLIISCTVFFNKDEEYNSN